jgi:Na+:H+ antiporter, NhaA family
MGYMRVTAMDRWVIDPINRFISNSSTGGVVLIISAFLAIFLANSIFSDAFFEFWSYTISFQLHDGLNVSMTLKEWVNNGLMSVFFFVIGLELKREIVAGELSNPKNAILPIVAGIGGMIFPALFYTYFNSGTEAMNGWGIPMATDLAFALGILYLLGDRIPTSLKIFLTGFSIVDDLGSVIVIALFYTNEISFLYLGLGLGVLALMMVLNLLGARNTVTYGVLGIAGVWFFFLLSGINPTIAAILAAFTIPAKTKINEKLFLEKMKACLDKFEGADPDNNVPTLTSEQLHILEKIENLNEMALTPLQKLEHNMHPIVLYIIMPIFALANAGVVFGDNIWQDATSNVALGVAIGLMLGKMIGIFGVASLLIKFKMVPALQGVTYKHLFGLGLIASIGFTMSLFINELAFTPLGEVGAVYITQAKIGIIIASLIGGLSGYFLLSTMAKRQRSQDMI